MKTSSQGSYFSYIIGFILSVALTLAAYAVVTDDTGSRAVTIAIICTLAVVQLVVQLVFFLHLGGRERGARWKQLAFWFAVLVVVIVVFGSLWIMNNLNYHMTPTQMEDHILGDEGISR